MLECQKCRGLVPESVAKCPNCSASAKWWRVPLAFAGGALATVTLSACYGPACASTVTLPDGTTRPYYGGYSCENYDCRQPLADGGVRERDAEWQRYCEVAPVDAGTDGGADAGADAGTDGGVDGGP